MLAISDFRAMIPACREYAYMQTSSYGPKPQPVLDEFERWLAFENQGPALPNVLNSLHAMFEGVRGKVAAAMNADASEITLTESTSGSIYVVANALDWRGGGNIIVSDQEHPANRTPWERITQRYGGQVRRVTAGPDYPRFLADLEGLMDEHTRLISLSHISRETGLRLPVDGIVALGHRRGVPVFIDGAQAFGAIAVDVHALGCDFYAFSGHKYVLGPQGTAGLYVSRAQLDANLGWQKPAESIYGPTQQPAPPQSASWFEHGTRDLSRYAGLGKALDMWTEAGWENAHNHMATMAARAKQYLLEIPGVVVDTPLELDKSSSIVVFRLPLKGWKPWDTVTSLIEHEKVITVGNAMPQTGVRASFHVFNDDQDLDRLISGVKRILAEGNHDASG